MAEIPKHIQRKLFSIYNHQFAVKKLVDDIMIWAGIEDITDEENGWDWGMHIDLQGDMMIPQNSEKLLSDYIELKS